MIIAKTKVEYGANNCQEFRSFDTLNSFLIFFFLHQVDGMDALAVKQACSFAKQHALKNGPIVSISSAI